jgi:hypothetical protein
LHEPNEAQVVGFGHGRIGERIRIRQHVSCNLDTEHEGSVTVAVQYARPACPDGTSYDGCHGAAGFSTAGKCHGHIGGRQAMDDRVGVELL